MNVIIKFGETEINEEKKKSHLFAFTLKQTNHIHNFEKPFLNRSDASFIHFFSLLFFLNAKFQLCNQKLETQILINHILIMEHVKFHEMNKVHLF